MTKKPLTDEKGAIVTAKARLIAATLQLLCNRRHGGLIRRILSMG
ncbi:hypothetical protein ALQ07_101396 [Pseudomonas syringae pv. actinidiae]|uniref:Uncharacterized protein n=4 Tax=Pseudomonas syringae group TaxID=136849 RepID=A0A3M5TP00_9PSED|nr:hypothetical protein ALO40_101239 [Pseudomonas syringae pv. viburni]RMQ26785.1 hypothetical protein ALQ07_101396 [Pseudomonas syringae pv. actinidiae]RMR03023.1 hypothetical protein ALP92_101809 [Pseudomonas syringae pv. primulae]RMU35253.1 hypothetical protein ALP32_102043 [Pseudomonas avellanae]